MAQGDLGILNLYGFTIGVAEGSAPGIWTPLVVDAANLSGRRIKTVQLPSGAISLAETNNAGYYGLITMSTSAAAGRAWKLVDMGGVEVTFVQTDSANVWALLTIDAVDASAANYRRLDTDNGALTLVETGTTGKRAVLTNPIGSVSGTSTVVALFGRQFAVNSGIVINSGTSPLLTSLVSHWSLDEVSGTRVDDYGDNDLTDNNTVTQGVGKVGNAGLFTRVNSEYLNITSNAALLAGDIDLTLACWVKFTTIPGSMGMMMKDNNGGEPNNREYGMQYASSNTKFVFRASGNGSTVNQRYADTFGAPTTDVWYFVVGWHDSAANTISIQVNNGGVDTSAHTTGIFLGTNAFYIGQLGNTNYLNGLLDQAAIWKRVLTAAEKTWIYGSGNGRSWADILAYRG